MTYTEITHSLVNFNSVLEGFKPSREILDNVILLKGRKDNDFFCSRSTNLKEIHNISN